MTQKANKPRSRGTAARATPSTAAIPQEPRARSDGPFGIVAIGASAGGLEAFTALLKEIPPDTGMAFVSVQHLSPGHTSMLADILGRATPMPVREVRDEPRVEPNHVYVIPPGRTMIIKDGVLSLNARGEGPYHPVDMFMTSLAQDQGHRSIGVVLSGTANDGTIGLGSIKEVGGITFAQDDTAQQDGMPRSAIAAGVVDFVLSPPRIAKEIVRLAREPYVVDPTGAVLDRPDDVDQILSLMQREQGVDFTQYKSNTLHRRIKRRMTLLKMTGLGEYTAYLRKTPAELEVLYQDILISVTNFFRNPEAFEALKRTVLPRLFKERGRQDPIRVWVLGCSTGEEPYSIAIALTEYAAEAHSTVPITIYATDLNNASIDKARIGLYPKTIAQDVSPERLRRFFVESEGGYRVTKPIRDLCIFARHNVLSNPPFSRMDLISCRNVMIYMEPSLQRKLMPILHYALKPTGFLLLGPSETVGSNRELFEPVDAKNKIYTKMPLALRLDQAFLFIEGAVRPERPTERWRERPPLAQVDLQREADRVLLARYLPAGVLVNTDFDVLQFRGDTGQYLTPAPGKASLNVLKMAREGLLVSLRALLQKAKKEDVAVGESAVCVKTNGGYHEISLNIIPIGRTGSIERCYWILFERLAPEPRAVRGAAAETARERALSRRRSRSEATEQVTRLTQELAATRDYLQSVIEQQEAANEELQSINEELETSKEEIQSSNEELTTVNEELHTRNEELNRANNDLNNLFGSVQMAIVMVWPDLRIRRFTPMAEKVFNMITADIGRPIGDIQMNLQLGNFRELLQEAIDTVTVKELEVQDRQGHWYLLRLRPYRTIDNRIDGAVIVLVDIDQLKQSQDVLQRNPRMLEQTHDAVLVRELDGTIVYWNRGAEVLYGYSRAEAQLRKSQHLRGGTEAQRREVDAALAAAGQWSGEVVQRTRDGREIVVDAKLVLFSEGERKLVLEANSDVTERRRLEASLRGRVEELAAADQHKNEFLALLAHELRNPLAPLRNALQIMKMAGAESDAAIQAREMIDRQVAILVRLVDQLLDAARINRGQVQLRMETVELQRVIQLAVDSTRASLEAHRHRLTVQAPEEPLLIGGDPTRLEQVFANLLANAVKYTPDGGQISVRVEHVELPSVPPVQHAVVRIKDSGSGIAPEVLDRVFDLFFQADRSLAHAQGGLGIGLSVVRRLVQLHGGRVEAFSAGPGKGSEFVVHLPLAAASRRPAPASEGEHAVDTGSSAAAASAQRVLVVDDNQDVAESTSTLLALSGHQVKVALNGEQALELAGSFRPGVVLLDIGLPGLDGYELCRRLREQPGGRQRKLIAVTGYGELDKRARAREAGFDHYLLKPVDLGTLKGLLRGATS